MSNYGLKIHANFILWVIGVLASTIFAYRLLFFSSDSFLFFFDKWSARYLVSFDFDTLFCKKNSVKKSKSFDVSSKFRNYSCICFLSDNVRWKVFKLPFLQCEFKIQQSGSFWESRLYTLCRNDIWDYMLLVCNP